jgi:integrase
MNELALTKELLSNIKVWMIPKYAIGTINTRVNLMKQIFRTYKVLNKDNLKSIMKRFKYQYQRATLVMINNYCYDNNIDFHLIIPSLKRTPIKLPEILSMEEIKLIIESAPYPYNLAIRCIFNMGAGLRVSEIIKFSWGHIRWVDWLQNQNSYGVALIKSGKGSKDRVVNIPQKLMSDLYQYAKELNVLNEYSIPTGSMIFKFGFEDKYIRERRKRLKVPSIDDGWKFDYVHYSYDWFRYNIIKRYCEKALNKHIKIHSLRHCVSEDTEILTINGWKNYNSIKKGDIIFSYNVKKDCIERDSIKDINKYFFTGNLERIKNSYIDTLITPEHKIVVKEISRKYNPIEYSLVKFSELNKKAWNINYKLSSKLNDNNIKIGIEQSGILGWILSDGHISNRKEPTITISQSYSSNLKKCLYIKNLLDKSKTPYSLNIRTQKANPFRNSESIFWDFTLLKGGNHSKYNLGKNHEWIFKYINKDRTPNLNEILSLSFQELESLYNSIMLGDGTKKNYNSREYAGQNKERIELVRILCCLLGHISSKGSKEQNKKKYSRVYIRENKDYCQLLGYKGHFSKEKYKGIVWCPETNNGTFIAKRNNKCFITGNSRSTYLYEYENVPIEKLQVLLGHSSLNTTMLYTKVNPRKIFEQIKETKEL